jgi:hypothetical protein
MRCFYRKSVQIRVDVKRSISRYFAWRNHRRALQIGHEFDPNVITCICADPLVDTGQSGAFSSEFRALAHVFQRGLDELQLIQPVLKFEWSNTFVDRGESLGPPVQKLVLKTHVEFIANVNPLIDCPDFISNGKSRDSPRRVTKTGRMDFFGRAQFHPTKQESHDQNHYKRPTRAVHSVQSQTENFTTTKGVYILCTD